MCTAGHKHVRYSWVICGVFCCCFFFLLGASPIFPFLETSQPQLSRSPRLQFLVRVYMTPAALMAWTKEVSLVAVNERTWGIMFYMAYKAKTFQTFFNYNSFKKVFTVPTYHVLVLWAGLRCRDSPICPTQTGVCTPLSHSVRPPARFLHRWDRPAGEAMSCYLGAWFTFWNVILNLSGITQQWSI